MKQYAIFSYRQIAQFFNVSITTVGSICRKHISDIRYKMLRPSARTRAKVKAVKEREPSKQYLPDDQAHQITYQNELVQCMGLSLQERCMYFQTKFMNPLISIYTIRQLYKMSGVRKKQIKMGKLLDHEKQLRQDV